MKLKRIGFQRERSVLVAEIMKYQDMASSMVSKDISASPAGRLSLTLHVHHYIKVRKILLSGYYILNV